MQEKASHPQQSSGDTVENPCVASEMEIYCFLEATQQERRSTSNATVFSPPLESPIDDLSLIVMITARICTSALTGASIFRASGFSRSSEVQKGTMSRPLIGPRPIDR